MIENKTRSRDGLMHEAIFLTNISYKTNFKLKQNGLPRLRQFKQCNIVRDISCPFKEISVLNANNVCADDTSTSRTGMSTLSVYSLIPFF